jgi:hypothetical protein
VNIRTSNPRNVLKSLLRRLAVTGSARVRVLQGMDAPEISSGSGASSSWWLMFAILAAALTALVFTAAPALAAEAACAGLPEPERAHEEQLRTENNSLQLPDCRAYELVSPADKSGGIADVYAREYQQQYLHPMQASADGEAITYNAEAFGQTQAGETNQYVSRRTPSGWGTIDVTPPTSQVEGGTSSSRAVVASNDLSAFLFATQSGDTELSPEAPEGYRNVYLSTGAGVPTPLITSVPSNRSGARFGEDEVGDPNEILFVPASEDLSRVYFGANAVLTEQAPAGSESEDNLYRWTAGKLHVINVLPDEMAEPGATLGFVYGKFSTYGKVIPDLEHVVSANGMRAFWTDEHNHNLYLREDYFEGSEEKERTILVGGENAEFLAADREGSVVFFTKEGELYEYEVPTGTLVDVTPTASAGVQGMVGMSEDGEYFYFVAKGALAGNENAEGQKAAPDEDNLYVYQPGSSGLHETRFVATLSGEDNQPDGTYDGGEAENGRWVADWTPEVQVRQAEASPNGQFLAFGSHLSLTGQVNEGPEIFVYDATTEVLSCASCSPSGESNEGAELPPFGDSFGMYEPRYMLSDGRLFFTTAAALVPQDVNHERDVYEWESGEVHLISGGESSRPSVFADASENGRDVFFTTSQALVPEDRDEITDMYDAREGGGFPAPTVSPQCGSSGECQGGPSSPLVFGAPSSVTLSESGNVAPSPAPVVAPPRGTTKLLSRAQKLAGALRACRKNRSKRKRTSCEKQARVRYGAKKQSKPGSVHTTRKKVR